MSTIITQSTQVKRALAFLIERRAENTGASLSALLDEAGQRFNLSPLDAQALENLFRQADKEAAANKEQA